MAAKKKKSPARKKTPAAAKKKAPAAKKKAAPAKAKSGTGGLQAGSNAPAFSLPGDDGKTHSLAQHKGKAVVVYFYPRDDTPGCTVEACEFRDSMNRVKKAGAVVYGVSKDSLKSHDRFKAKYNLNFTLLSDEDLKVHRAYGAYGKKVMYGKEVDGVIRSTFLVGPDGKLARVWPRVKVAGHVDAVLEALAEL